MQDANVRHCGCPDCVAEGEHPNKELHRQMNLLLSRLDEQQRRWYAAVESRRLGHGGDRLMSLITGMSVTTIRRGRRELQSSLEEVPQNRVRRKGAGRPVVATRPWWRWVRFLGRVEARGRGVTTGLAGILQTPVGFVWSAAAALWAGLTRPGRRGPEDLESKDGPGYPAAVAEEPRGQTG